MSTAMKNVNLNLIGGILAVGLAVYGGYVANVIQSEEKESKKLEKIEEEPVNKQQSVGEPAAEEATAKEPVVEDKDSSTTEIVKGSLDYILNQVVDTITTTKDEVESMTSSILSALLDTIFVVKYVSDHNKSSDDLDDGYSTAEEDKDGEDESPQRVFSNETPVAQEEVAPVEQEEDHEVAECSDSMDSKWSSIDKFMSHLIASNGEMTRERSVSLGNVVSFDFNAAGPATHHYHDVSTGKKVLNTMYSLPIETTAPTAAPGFYDAVTLSMD